MKHEALEISRNQALYALVVMVLVNSVNYMDRYVVSILFPMIKADLLLSDTQLGLLGGLAFTVFYASMALPVGWAVDRHKRKYVLSVGILIWSVATFASGTAGAFITLFVARALTGSGESSAHPAGVSLLGDYFSPKVRTTAIAIFQLGVPIGAGVGIIIGGLLAQKYGWRGTFFIYAVPGAVLIPFILMMKEPVRGASEGLTAKESQRISHEGLLSRVRKILSTKTLFYHYTASVLIMFGSQGFAIWLPTYLKRAKGFDLEMAATLSGVGMLVGGIVGSLGGAAIADRRFRKDKKARLKCQSCAAALAIPFFIIIVLASSKELIVPAIFFAYILSLAMFPMLSAIIIDLVEPRDRGVAMALLLLLQTGIGFSLGPLAVGAISDLTGSLAYGLIIMPVSYLFVILMGSLGSRYILFDYKCVRNRIAGLHHGT